MAKRNRSCRAADSDAESAGFAGVAGMRATLLVGGTDLPSTIPWNEAPEVLPVFANSLHWPVVYHIGECLGRETKVRRSLNCPSRAFWEQRAALKRFNLPPKVRLRDPKSETAASSLAPFAGRLPAHAPNTM